MIRLHHCPGTRSMRSLWLLHELGVEFERIDYPFDKSLRQEPYRSLNPAGRVPALEMDGVVITESGAIAEVLCEVFGQLGRLPGNPERVQWLVWVHFAETISQHTAALTQQHVMLREDHMRSPIIMQLEAKRLAKMLSVVEEGLQGDYLLSTFSAADIGVGQALYMAKHFVELAPFPRVAAWFDLMQSRDAFQRSLPDGDGLYLRGFYAPWPLSD